ncbi:MAG: four helix bundle protein [Candidatus Uhrbacteria bacterium]
MKEISEAPVFTLSFNLLKDIYLLRKKFPKTEKYTLGGQMEQTALEMMLNIIQAGRAKKPEKMIPLESAIKQNDTIKILFRLAEEINVINHHQYLEFQEKLQKNGQMLGGWLRSI